MKYLKQKNDEVNNDSDNHLIIIINSTQYSNISFMRLFILQV